MRRMAASATIIRQCTSPFVCTTGLAYNPTRPRETDPIGPNLEAKVKWHFFLDTVYIAPYVANKRVATSEQTVQPTAYLMEVSLLSTSSATNINILKQYASVNMI